MSEALELPTNRPVEMYDAETKKAFNKALAAAQGQIKNAIKDVENDFFNKKYADLGAVWDACREPVSSNGLAVLQFPDYDTGSGVVTVETIITHADGYERSFQTRVPVGKKDAQGVGSAITYARRYALMAAVGIAPEDDDGNSAVQGKQQAQNKPAQNGSLTKGKSRDLYSELQQDIDSADSTDALKVWKENRRQDVDQLPADWKQELQSRYVNKYSEIQQEQSHHVQ